MITIEEIDVPDALRVVLEGEDLPFAQERETAAFESGGKLQKERIDLPGGRVIVHVTAAPERPLVLRGAFLDWRTSLGHARDMRDQLLALWRRANPVRITWGSETRIGLLDEPKFGEESEHAVSYELTFEILDATGSLAVGAEAAPQPSADLAAVLRARLAARRAALAKLPLKRGLLAERVATVDAALAALAVVEREVDALDRTFDRQVAARARRVLAVTQRAQNLLATLQRVVRGLDAQVAASAYTASSAIETWKAQFATGVEVQDVLDGLRALRVRARARVAARVRLYRVKPGDTLEAIARAQLGY